MQVLIHKVLTHGRLTHLLLVIFRKCKLTFDSEDHLANHKRKFCVESNENEVYQVSKAPLGKQTVDDL